MTDDLGKLSLSELRELRRHMSAAAYAAYQFGLTEIEKRIADAHEPVREEIEKRLQRENIAEATK